MKRDTILRLGRISNLPTVWTNALAGAVLSVGGLPQLWPVLVAALALTLFYEGGMWLNDAFDAEIDARERANRPIPMGEISRRTVYTGGALMLAVGVALSFALGALAGVIGIGLAMAILAYDVLHKRTVFSPVLMGITRFLSYLLGAAAVGGITGMVILGAIGLFAHIVGLTYAAKQEAYDRIDRIWPLAALVLPVMIALVLGGGRAVALLALVLLVGVMAVALYRLLRRQKGDVPFAVVTLIAGTSLYDAALVAGAGLPALGLVAIAGFGLCLLLQRVASGT